MKVIFDFNLTDKGHELSMKCSDMTQLESGAYDTKEYYQCFKAIQQHINLLVEAYEEKKVSKIANTDQYGKTSST